MPAVPTSSPRLRRGLRGKHNPAEGGVGVCAGVSTLRAAAGRERRPRFPATAAPAANVRAATSALPRNIGSNSGRIRTVPAWTPAHPDWGAAWALARLARTSRCYGRRGAGGGRVSSRRRCDCRERAGRMPAVPGPAFGGVGVCAGVPPAVRAIQCHRRRKIWRSSNCPAEGVPISDICRRRGARVHSALPARFRGARSRVMWRRAPAGARTGNGRGDG